MTNQDLTHIYVVLDRSGSMSFIKRDTEGGFNTFMNEQEKQPGTCKVTLAQFDDAYEIVYSDLPVNEVPDLVLVPRGSTALLDAIGKTINTAGAQLEALAEDERPASVIFVILTDGQENSSREYVNDQIKELINHQRDTYAWLFKFFGADENAIQTAGRMGIAVMDSATYNPQNVGMAFAAASNSTTSFRNVRSSGGIYAAASASAAFTDADRASMSGIDLDEEEDEK